MLLCIKFYTLLIMKKLLFTLLSVSFLMAANAQDTVKFKPSGKPEALIFTDFRSSFQNGENVNKFSLSRAYFGYGYNFSPSLSGRVLFDVGNPGVGSFQLTALLKYGYLQYQKQKLTIKFGMIGTNGFDVQEKLWGYRYIYKSFQDEYGFGSSADLGLSAAYKISNAISADVIVQNGEGYKSLDVDSVLKAGIGLTVRPVKNILLRGYFDYMAKGSAAQQTTALLAGYQNETFRLGVEYNHQTDSRLRNGYDFSGYSAYGTFNFNSRSNIFARYDYLTSENLPLQEQAWNYNKDGQIYMAGFEFTLIKGIKISPNYQLWRPRENSAPATSSVFLNVEIKL